MGGRHVSVYDTARTHGETGLQRAPINTRLARVAGRECDGIFINLALYFLSIRARGRCQLPARHEVITASRRAVTICPCPSPASHREGGRERVACDRHWNMLKQAPLRHPNAAKRQVDLALDSNRAVAVRMRDSAGSKRSAVWMWNCVVDSLDLGPRLLKAGLPTPRYTRYCSLWFPRHGSDARQSRGKKL